MKINEITQNYESQIDFHKPTKTLTGSAIQINALRNGSISVQIAKQKTANSRESKATYAWTEPDKNSFFILSADEIRRVTYLINKALNHKIRLFVQNEHKPPIRDGEDTGYDYLFFYHSIGENSKSISFYFKKYNERLQLCMNVYDKKNNKSNSFQFNFDLLEAMKLNDIFSFHQSKEFLEKQGIRSIVCDSDSEVVLDAYMPLLNISDYIKFYKEGNYIKRKINGKCYDATKNIMIYIV